MWDLLGVRVSLFPFRISEDVFIALVFLLDVSLVIWVHPLALLVWLLNGFLEILMVLLNTSQVPLHSSIIQNLCSSLVLQLHCVELVFVSFLLLHDASLSNLLSSLKVNLVFLSLSEPLKVVWLDSVWGKLRNFSLLIFCHEIMSGGEI